MPWPGKSGTSIRWGAQGRPRRGGHGRPGALPGGGRGLRGASCCDRVPAGSCGVGLFPSTLRSYACELLGWLRFLQAVAVPWDRATRAEARDYALWLARTRKPPRHRRGDSPVPGAVSPVTGKPHPAETYAIATRRHARAGQAGPGRNAGWPVPPRLKARYSKFTARSCSGEMRSRVGSMSPIWPPAGDATSPSKKNAPSGDGRPSRFSGPQASAPRNWPGSHTTASSHTRSPAPARSSRCSRSLRPRPTPRGCSQALAASLPCSRGGR